ncbi:MFS transporter [Domibacillus sp. DTU_2020_1001157_1_SI_ALB_TIR_016]|uniref:MFS transporter n=1 Tax=Domibacillus sp. DTU_2020_1001157_1_SI_ALB_TIR_016 TaxID=3077789 RepID=UPI0028E46A8C|nr:MFS transporter [Domibacillus sp. DTU_2020_1001157_1_SI_ALB_TIR_016]WNS79598.1 MFS transporter [Domibacillus sp. DTU_2020_1001157_1_SI_ALB_TIR_016]
MSNATTPLEKQVTKKVTRRIVPFLILLYVIAFIDRANLGYAALDMNEALSLTSQMFGIASGIFFISYFMLEVPSNVMLEKFGARKWIARILVTWGIVVALTGFVQSAAQLYILRFLLGGLEAGFFPGIILYLTYWFRAKERAKTIAMFMTAIAVSYIIGAPLSTWIMDNIHWAGMDGWRWMFILEGIPAVILGVFTLFYLTDRPEQAKWLTSEEKNWLTTELKKEKEENAKAEPGLKQHSHKQTLTNPRVWYLALIYFTFNIGLYGIGFWLPQILKSLSDVLTNTQVGLLTTIPYIAGAIAMNIWSRRSDRSGERRIHAAIPLIVGSVGLFASGMTSNPLISIAMMAVAVSGMYSFYGPFWSLATQFLSTSAAAVGIAAINSIGNLSGFAGPYAIGAIYETTGSVSLALFFLSGALLLASVFLFAMRKNQLNQPVGQPAELAGESVAK